MSRRGLWPGLGLALLALASTATSLGNLFAGDDVYIIVLNDRVHTIAPFWDYLRQSYWPAQFGSTLYRPLTILGFAVQWKLGGGMPLIFHVVNVLLYLGATFAVWVLARQLLPAAAAWLVAAYFTVNPVHVESSANVVGQPEIMVALLQTVAVAWYVASRRRGAPRPLVVVGIVVLYVLACLTKENGVVLPGLLLAAEWLLVSGEASIKERIRALGPLYALLAGIAIAYLLGRNAVLGGVVGEYPNPAIRGVSFGVRFLTMLPVVPQWWRLLLVPWHLQADYMPVEIDRATSFGPGQLLGVIFVLAWLFGIWGGRRTLPVMSFGLAWAAVTLFPVSNLVAPTGILLAERTLVSPSVGACLALGGLAPWLATRVAAARLWERRLAACLAALILGLWVWRSATRARVWHDDDRMIRQMVVDAPFSYRAHALMGRVLFEERDPAQGEREYLTAIRLYPYDPNVFAGLARQYRDAGLYRQAIPLFRKALELAPQMIPARNMLIYCLVQSGDSVGAQAELAEKFQRHDPDADRIRSMVDSVEQQLHAPSAPRR
ncbi:MAG TPA: tetratricopeptide repeat protein [Gemmatimonadales bacterium]|nr:tetratricopeptide repeat protein [Gemmatimonadales bacterium]